MSDFLFKAPCPACRELGQDRKGDNLAVYDDDHGYCFKCGHVEGSPNMDPSPAPRLKGPEMTGVPGAIKDRRITESIVRKFGVTLEYNKDGSISKHHYPYYNMDTEEVISTKSRCCKTKDFYFSGFGTLGEAGLFGQQVWPSGGKFITVTEGEIDAMAVSEMFDGKWPVVSLKTGAAGAVKDIKQSLEWLETFEKVVICFDNDPAGKKATREVLNLFSPGKVKSISLPLKDAGDMLQEGKVQEFVKAWWNSKDYRPDGIVTLKDIIKEIEEEEEVESVDYPWECLNEKTHGFRAGELVTITSGAGMGKSQFMREVEYHLYNVTNDIIGIIALEEVPKMSGLGVASILANKPLHRLPRDMSNSLAKEEKLKWLRQLDDTRFSFWKHWGSTNEDNLFSRIRYMAKAFDCKWFVLDHLSIIVSDQDMDDERKAIDSIMTKLRSLVQELNIGMFLVSHLKRPTGKAHEDGGQISLAELRGSASIAQLSDIVLGLERNQQHEDEDIRNTTTVRVLKNRFTGLTGPACYLYYDQETGRMSSVSKPGEVETDAF
jgi:twinkle protein